MRTGEQVQGLKSTNWRYKMGDVKNSIGNGVGKELTCMTHGHELREGIAGGNGGTTWREAQGQKLEPL